MKAYVGMGITLLTGVAIGVASVGGLNAQGKATGMRVHNLYVDAEGKSHFRDIPIEWVKDAPSGKTSKQFPATSIIFRETSGDYDLAWHPAPARQYVINLDAAVEMTASDGERRVIGAGEVVLVETRAAHLSKAVAGKSRRSIFVTADWKAGDLPWNSKPLHFELSRRL